jgi:predicted DNA-binding transcriptional regulator AlpA
MSSVSRDNSANVVSLDAALKEGPNTFLTSRNVAHILGLKSTVTLARWRCDRKGLPFIRLGPTRVAYRAADVLAYVESKRVEVAPAAAA